MQQPLCHRRCAPGHVANQAIPCGRYTWPQSRGEVGRLSLTLRCHHGDGPPRIQPRVPRKVDARISVTSISTVPPCFGAREPVLLFLMLQHDPSSSAVAAMPRSRSDRILVSMCVLIAVNQLGFGGIVPALALYARSFGVSQSAIGLAIAVYGLARFLIAVPAGRLADALGRRATLAVGGVVSALGNLLCALAPTYPGFVAARFVAGAGAALVLTTGLIVLADISTPSNRGRMMSVYQGVFIFAVGIGP